MSFNFPDAPVANQEYTPPGSTVTYIWKAPIWAAQAGGVAAGTPEAPTDGKQYGRQNTMWTEVLVNPTWTTLTGKPTTFPPTLPILESDVTNLVTDLAGKQPTIVAGTTSQYYRGDKTFQTLDKTAAGLANVDNTSDVNKPVSTATQTALNLKESTANKGVANGYASLDAGSKVPAAQLPAYVDDVLEYANLAAFPGTGTTGIIYVALDTNKTYRWSGSAYVEISPSPGSTDSVPEGSVNLYYTNARASAAAPVQSVAGRTGVVTLTKTDVGLANVDNTSDANKPVSTAQATADALAVLKSGSTMTGNLKISVADGALGLLVNGATKGVRFVASSTYFSIEGVDNTGVGSYQPLRLFGSSIALAAKVTTAAGVAGNAPFNVPHGVAPTAPVDGDLWTTTVGLYARVNGTTIGPYGPTGSFEPILAAGTTAQYYRGDKSWQTHDKASVGLANVDNTTDVNKPVSTATQTALNLKLDSASYTAADVLTKIKTVDGAASGLDADVLDGQDGAYYLAWGNFTGKPATFPPTLPILESDVTSLVSDLALKAPLASPAFTGNPTAPTPTAGDNDTSIATTAFVANAVSGAGGFVEAPLDGISYGRKSAGWSPVVARTGDTMTGSLTVQGTITTTFGDFISTYSDASLAATGAGNIYLRPNGTTTNQTWIDTNGRLRSESLVSMGTISATSSVSSSNIFQASGTTVTLATTGAGTIQLRPNGSGSTTGQTTLTASGNMSVAGAVTTTTGNIISGSGYLVSSTANLYLGTNSAGQISLRPNGSGSTTGETTIAATGDMTVNGALTAAALTVTGTSTLTGWATGTNGFISGSSYFVGSTTQVIIGPNSGGTPTGIRLRPTAFNSATGETTIDSAGVMNVGNNIVTSGSVTSSQSFVASGTAVTLATTGAGTILLRPNGSGSTTGQTTIGSSGTMTVANNVTSTAGYFIGSTTGIVVGMTPGGTGWIYFRPVDYALPTGQTVIKDTGDMIVAGGVTTTGGYLLFPTTAIASANANALDDYEEGTWTPTINFAGAAVGVTYGTRAATYTKIGRLVYVQWDCTLTAKGSSVGQFTVAGLPFAGVAISTASSLYYSTFTGLTGVPRAFLSSVSMLFVQSAAATVSAMTDVHVTATTRTLGSMCYIA